MNSTPDLKPAPSYMLGRPTVYIVDDDDGMRRGLEFLLKSADLPVKAFASPQEFLAAYNTSMRGCLLLDMRMPGMSGFDLQDQLRKQHITIPVIIITGYATVQMAVRAMRVGAFDFIEKPFDDRELVDLVHRALQHCVENTQNDEKIQQIEKRLARLTPRERQVMECVVSGMPNKEIAAKLDISMKTVENHRARVMEKLDANTLPELVRMAVALNIGA